MRRLWLLALCLLASTQASGRIYTVDDMLRMEEYGQVAFAPRAGLMLFERMRRYDSASDYSLHYFVRRQLTSVMAVELGGRGAAAPLFEHEADAGYWMAGLSPDGRRLAVFRIARGSLSLGVVDLASRKVSWLPQTPDMPAQSARPVWIGDTHLVFIAMAEPRLPLFMSLGKADREDKQRLWRLQEQGVRRSVVAVSSRGGPESDRSRRILLLVDLADGRARELASGDLIDVSAPRHGRRLAVMYAGTPVTPSAEPVDIAFSSRRHAIEIVSLDGAVIKTRCGDALPGTMLWNGRGTRLLAVVRHGSEDWRAARYVQIDLDGRCLHVASAPRLSLQGSRQVLGRGWLGDAPAVLASAARKGMGWRAVTPSGSRLLPVSPNAVMAGTSRDGLLMLDGGRLLKVGRRGTSVLVEGVASTGPSARDPFTAGIRPLASPQDVDFAIAGATGRRELVPLGSSSTPGRPEALSDGVSVLEVWKGFRALLVRDGSGAEELRLASGAGPCRTLDRINSHLRDLDPLQARMVKSLDPSGTVVSWLYLPKGPGPHPLVVIPYPGMTFDEVVPRQDAPDEVGAMDNARFLLARGYAVLRPGVTAIADPNSRGVATLDRIDAAVDAAVATGLIDRTRLGMLGHSFGAYAAMSVATRTRRYRAVVAADGAYDLAFEHGSMSGAEGIRMENGIPFGHAAWTETGQGAMGGPADPLAFDPWIAASPRRWLKDVQVPVLLVHGEMDPVGLDQAEGAFLDMARLGKDVSLLRYYGEGHALYSPANLRDYYGRVAAFFDEHIGPSGRTRRLPPSPTSDP